MDSRRGDRGIGGRQELAAALRDSEGRPPQRLRGRGAEADQSPGFDDRQLGFEPGPACRDLDRVRLLVDPFLASRLPFEVLHDIGYVDLPPVDAGFLQAGVEKPPRRTHEWAPFDVFLVARLLTNQKESGADWPFPKDCLSPALP